LDYEDFCINELLQITTDEVLMEYESLGKNVSINIHADENIMVHADRIMLVRLFINLLSNSIKYGTQNGVTDVYLSKNDTVLQCNVFDNGIGISAENLSEVWKPFFRVDRSNLNSNGLGLPMVKKIVSVHNGSIRIESTLGEGTKFYISMPIIL
jgi:signal transduction histidine kinase